MTTALNRPTFFEAQFRPIAQQYGEHVIEFNLGKKGTLTGVLWGFVEKMPRVYRSAYNVTSFEVNDDNVVEGGFRVVPPEIIQSIRVLGDSLQTWLNITPNAKQTIVKQNKDCKVDSKFTKEFFGVNLNDGKNDRLKLMSNIMSQIGVEQREIDSFIQ